MLTQNSLISIEITLTSRIYKKNNIFRLKATPIYVMSEFKIMLLQYGNENHLIDYFTFCQSLKWN